MIKLCDVGPIWREGEQGGKQMKNWRGRTGSGAEAGRGETFGRGAGAGERVVKNLARGGEAGRGLGAGARWGQNKPFWTETGWGYKRFALLPKCEKTLPNSNT